jgi:hypothetical protein
MLCPQCKEACDEVIDISTVPGMIASVDHTLGGCLVPRAAKYSHSIVSSNVTKFT